MNDLISRQALCEYALNQKDKSVTPNDIMRFPSVEPERMRGRWIEKQGDYFFKKIWVFCSNCGEESVGQSNFCPNCGAMMEVESE